MVDGLRVYFTEDAETETSEDAHLFAFISGLNSYTGS